jgi:PAS domain S-box-containing protein
MSNSSPWLPIAGVAVWLWTSGFLAMLAPTASPAAPAEISAIADLKRLPGQSRGPGIPLKVKGVVLCCDSGWDQLYIHDGLDTGYFHPADFPPLSMGQEVEITGAASGSNTFTTVGLRILGQGILPSPKRLRLEELGRDQGDWVETTGRVLTAEGSRGRLALILNANQQNCLAYVLGGPPINDYRKLLDCKVRLRGINASRIRGSRLEIACVFVPGINEVTVVEAAGDKISRIPVVSISSLLNRELGAWTNQLVHINGLVISYEPGASVMVKDPTGIIRARIIQQTDIRGDEHVDLWGYLEASSSDAALVNACFEVVRPNDDTLTIGPEPLLIKTNRSDFLTNALQISKLNRVEAAQRFPVRLQGVMTYADPAWRNGFIQDKTGAIYVDLDPAQRNLQAGQQVELAGYTSPGGFAPEVISTSIAVLGTTNLPAPARVDLEDLANGHLDAHWVEMQGVVRRAEAQAGHLNLSLMTPNGRFKAIILGQDEQNIPAQFIDAMVSIRGACTSERNIRRQLSGITLHVPNMNQVAILEPAPTDPFAIETTRIVSVATFDPTRLAGRRIKLQGVVTLELPGQGFILQDASAGLRVLPRQTNQFQIGDLVDVLGFPGIGDFSPYLEEAVCRRNSTAPLPQATKVSADQILLHGTNDAQLVQISARLLQDVTRSANPQLVLQDGPAIFTAHLVNPGGGSQIPLFQAGSLLGLTGVCAIQGGERHEPATFRLLLSRPQDIVLLQTAPWWTPRHALLAGGGMTLAITASLAWVALLRRQVRSQTKLIRQKLHDEAALEARYRDLLENANDMVYTHDREGRLTSINQTGEKLLQRPRDQLLSRNIVEFVAPEQQSAARQWLESVLKDPAPTVEWDFLTGPGQRVKVEISTRLVEEGSRGIEVEGIARDITERKRLERELLEISNREQRRIGHDLHDGVCQQLAGIALMTSSLAEQLDEKKVGESAEAEKISSLLNDVIDQTRGVARGLFPVRLEQNGLVSALEELAVNSSELFKINCRFVCEEPPEAIENEVALHLYYIVLEAVANASKHGKAKNVTISLEPASPRQQLIIRDDGVGFVYPHAAQSGMGLRIMNYRARVIGATLTLRTSLGAGTEIHCLFLPIFGEWSGNGDNDGHKAAAHGGVQPYR